MRRLRPQTLVLLVLLPLLQAASPGETSVELVGKAVTGAVESLSKKILNTTAVNTTHAAPGPSSPALDVATLSPIAPSEGRAALDAARRAASVKPGEAPRRAGPLPHCGAACAELSDTLLAAVEGPLCRALFTSGKCPGGCMTEIAAVTGNATWAACRAGCEGDVVAGAGERWAKLCGSRQETLIDAGKEAVKTLVGEGLSVGLKRRALLQAFVGVLILLLGVGCGYRRGRVIAYRLGKRRLMGRKNSDANLPV